ncbi:neuropeptide F receptor-like [Portunus trituberculatus]|uniref:neuropeptide F receptor-like n=1 Tax=Portunus trituberculatus TaxID=210409 RepID=UPI001E1D1198|nr:neuropeptide F receptor-like [Portunus trituberculatus]
MHMTEWAAGGGDDGGRGGGGDTEGLEIVEGEENIIDSSKESSLNLQSLTFLNLASLDGNLSGYLTHNLTQLLNLTRDFDFSFVNKFANNRRVSEAAFASLLTAYGLLIVLGAAGNSLVVLAVVRKPAMRTARNVFIINLAISDLLLCLVTMPLTLMELLTQYWPLGDTPFVCRLVGTLQATSIFVSTISITAIALDRYHVIVYPTQTSMQKVGAVSSLLVVWVLAFLLALPNFLWRSLEHHSVNLPGLEVVSFCFEDWPFQHGRAYYSVVVILLQYCLPILTVSIAHARICTKLKYRMTSATTRASRTRKEDVRMRKTNTLLVAIALIFCLSWMPLNLYNVIVDLHNPFGDNTELMLVVYAVCHMAGMSSACSNPLLYGWLNDNFRKEFLEVFDILCPCCACPASTSRMGSLRTSRGGGTVKDSLTGAGHHHPVVLYTKAAEEQTSNGISLDFQEHEVTFISQVVTTTTL